MKKFLIAAFISWLLVLAWSGVSFAGTASYPEMPAKTVVTPVKTETNPLCFLDGMLCFDIHDRLRFEIRENNFDFDDSIRLMLAIEGLRLLAPGKHGARGLADIQHVHERPPGRSVADHRVEGVEP